MHTYYCLRHTSANVTLLRERLLKKLRQPFNFGEKIRPTRRHATSVDSFFLQFSRRVPVVDFQRKLFMLAHFFNFLAMAVGLPRHLKSFLRIQI